MPLNDILSAMRELILDADDGPTAPPARRAWIGERFPALTPTEADDLASVPAERFGVYTETIFAGERSMLRWAFPMSMAAIGRMLGERDLTQSVGIHLYEFVRAMHRFGPWRSHSIRGLARCFQRFVCSRADLIQVWPDLVDLVNFEKLELDVFYAADEPLVGMRPDEWEALSVEALLTTTVVVPAHVRIHAASFDVLALRDHWRENEALPDEWPLESRTFLVCGRDPETLRCRWVRHDEASHHVLGSLPRGEASSINEIATAWLAAQRADTVADEATAFAAFCGLLADWARAGIVMAPTDASA